MNVLTSSRLSASSGLKLAGGAADIVGMLCRMQIVSLVDESGGTFFLVFVYACVLGKL